MSNLAVLAVAPLYFSIALHRITQYIYNKYDRKLNSSQTLTVPVLSKRHRLARFRQKPTRTD